MKNAIKNILVFSLIFIVIFVLGATHIQYRLFQKSKNDFEIERKWLIDCKDIPYNLAEAEKYEIIQTYISFSPEIRVRKINEQTHILTVKDNLTRNGLMRTEHEYSISETDYNNLIKKREGNTIYKTRYVVSDGDNDLQIDVFEKKLKGLAYMEIEFDDADCAEAYETPDWVIVDVTDDIAYKNGHLARYGIPDSFWQYIK